MNKYLAIFIFVFCVYRAESAWYWPFGSNDDDAPPTLPELMEPATHFIDEASDLADEGKVDEAVEEYRKALDELVRLEIENPERAAQPEFATVRNKRAYIETAIDSLLYNQARLNAKAVAVTDTTALEKRYAEEQAAKAAAKANRGKTVSDRGRTVEPPEVEPEAAEKNLASEKAEAPMKPEVAEASPAPAKADDRPPAPAVQPAAGTDWRAVLAADPKNRRARMLLAREDYAKKDYAAAMLTLKELLQEKPNDAAALNFRAMVEKASGDRAAAEATLAQLIRSNPGVYYGYYNMAKLILETRGEMGKEQARYYYDTGRKMYHGPEDRFLEEHLK